MCVGNGGADAVVQGRTGDYLVFFFFFSCMLILE